MFWVDSTTKLLLILAFIVLNKHTVEPNVLLNLAKNNADSMYQNGTTGLKAWENRTTLRVALFPYIPDSGEDGYKSLREFITSEFEKQFPVFKLELRPIDQKDDFYDLSTLKDWLTNPVNGYDAVEIDTVLLGDLVTSGVVSPLRFPEIISDDWHPVAMSSLQFNRAYYGIPHLLCAFFLFTRAYNPARAKTIDELVESLGQNPSRVHRLVGNLNSSWELPAIWIDSVRDSFPGSSFIEAEALHDHTKYPFSSINKFARLCDVLGQTNPCIDGTFKDADYMTDLFAQGKASAMFGYSERLFRIMKTGFWNDINNVKAIPLPLGNIQNEPVFFTDAFVFRRHTSYSVRLGVEAFAHFMASPHMQAAIVGSADSLATRRIPRYLLPISKLAYSQPLLASDPFFQQTFRNLKGVPYPTAGFLNTRKELQNIILKNIK